MKTTNGTNGQTVSKAAFVRGCGANASVKSILQRGAAAGISLTAQYIATVRSQDRGRKNGGAKVLAPVANGHTNGTNGVASGGGDIKPALMKLALKHGIGAVETTLAGIRALA